MRKPQRKTPAAFSAGRSLLPYKIGAGPFRPGSPLQLSGAGGEQLLLLTGQKAFQGKFLSRESLDNYQKTC